MNKKTYLISFVVFLASVSLIVINFYTIKILSGVRAYIYGESQYSKGQKDALLFLSTYIQTEDPNYWYYFENAIKIPKGDNIARKALNSNKNDSFAYQGFLAGQNHPSDIPELIWLFKTFKSLTFMKQAITIWQDAEPLINQLDSIGNSIHHKIENKTLPSEEKVQFYNTISTVSSELSVKETAFSLILGNIARKINLYLLYANIIFIIIILGSLTLYIISMINKIRISENSLKTKNTELESVNKELDTFVYCVSHDLRSPINSMKGLVYLSKTETNIDSLNEYFVLMDTVLDKQLKFITEILDFFKHKRSAIVIEDINLKVLISEIIANNKYDIHARNTSISEVIAFENIKSDPLRIKIILNNLISNAIKYSDESKPDKRIVVKTYRSSNDLYIEVEDNGIGIRKENMNKVFDMFYVGTKSSNGTGLGLYILKHNIDKLKGSVKVESEINIGTKFTVTLPDLS